ncbi:HAMP domain-containing sensor histidine kinase [Roseisolibacter sp. H3M3-2]|uniref:sensor histidine kinase n=1 Tax=Roseisolibacter sp. H3M3-2 TaxID=3031323 RepID=UPI0023DAFC04|nr:HAMP domain-containing sensor histidine kinase [Roseisolibacter sp. H3M3-2]MDF1505115.1 HAMP domain-containing sensor histidine kinase [Roseisolibacter sp. H3M3-2]
MPRLLPAPGPHGRRVGVLVALLLASFALTAVLAWQAMDAAHSHRAAAHRTLRDYAQFAALQMAFRAKEGIYSRASAMLARPTDLMGGEPQGAAARLEEALDARHGHGCVDLMMSEKSQFLFRLDLRSRELRQVHGCGDGPPSAWLRDTIASHALGVFNKKWDHADLVADAGGRRWLFAYAVRYDDWDKPVAAFGFGAPFRDFAYPVFVDAMRYHAALPPSLVGTTPNDSLFSIVVTDDVGRELFRSRTQYASSFTAQYRLDKFGGIAVNLTLRPDVADRLVIGGLPQARLPQLLALLALTGALVVVAILQIRREYALARLREDFVSNISHELRTPLAQVRMFAETLLLGRVRSESEGRRSLEIIDQEARRLTHLVENVLQFSRSERRATRLSPEPTRLAEEVGDTLEAFAPIAQARGVTLAADLAPDVHASVDRAALRQALLNLLDNAVKYGPAGQTVRVGVRAAGPYAHLWVEDEGPGIAPRDRERVWLPFFRLERDVGSAVAGSGIGLAVVRDLVTLHGGRVRVEEARGGGARLLLELPALAAPPAPRVEAPDAPAASVPEPSPAHAAP